MGSRFYANANPRAQLQTLSAAAVGARATEEAFNRLSGNQASIRARSGAEDMRFKISLALFRDVLVTRVATANLALVDCTGDVVTLLRHSRGAATLAIDSSRHDFSGPSLIAYGPGARICVEAADAAADSAILPPQALRSQAEMLLGEALPDSALDAIAARVPLSCGPGDELAKHLNYALASAIAAEAGGHSALAVAGHRELLLSFSAATLFPAIARSYGAPALDCGSRLAGRARDYLDAHAAEPISLAELARELGVGMRSLQHNFKKAFGLSLRDYLMERRLEIARRLLAEANERVSVTDAAMAAGFSDLSHFAGKYRARYGHSPSDARRAALRRARPD